MSIFIEDIGEAAMAAKAVRDWLKEEGHRRGHSINCCGCRICMSYRAMEPVIVELRDASTYELQRK